MIADLLSSGDEVVFETFPKARRFALVLEVNECGFSLVRIYVETPQEAVEFLEAKLRVSEKRLTARGLAARTLEPAVATWGDVESLVADLNASSRAQGLSSRYLAILIDGSDDPRK